MGKYVLVKQQWENGSWSTNGSGRITGFWWIGWNGMEPILVVQAGMGKHGGYNGSSRNGWNGRSVLVLVRPATDCRLEPLVRRLPLQ